MNWRAALAAALVLVAGIGAAAWFGLPRFLSPAPQAARGGDHDATAGEEGDDGNVIDGDGEGTFGAPVDAGVTPMAQRVAVLGLLNKRNGVSRDVTIKPGQAIRVGDVVLRLRACERTAPWEQEQLTGAFVQMDVQGIDKGWRRVFSGWLYKERPALNVVLHPVYDVWTKSCTVAFPVDAPVAKASNAAKSAAGAAAPSNALEPAAEASAADDSAAPSNAR